MNEQDVLSTTEVAQALRATNQTIRNWIENDRIRAIRVGRRYLIARSELARLQIELDITLAGETVWDHTQAAIPLKAATDAPWADR